jgi:hypothetical protein
MAEQELGGNGIMGLMIGESIGHDNDKKRWTDLA